MSKEVLIDHAIDIGRVLGAIRVWKNKTQPQLAKTLGVSDSIICKVERYGKYLTNSFFKQLCAALGVTPAMVLHLEAEMRDTLKPCL